MTPLVGLILNPMFIYVTHLSLSLSRQSTSQSPLLSISLLNLCCLAPPQSIALCHVSWSFTISTLLFVTTFSGISSNTFDFKCSYQVCFVFSFQWFCLIFYGFSLAFFYLGFSVILNGGKFERNIVNLFVLKFLFSLVLFLFLDF